MAPPPPTGANSAAARDIANVMHPYTDLKTHMEVGPVVITRGKGVRVWDETGKEYIESVAGLWCAALGFDNERLVQAAAIQMRKLPAPSATDTLRVHAVSRLVLDNIPHVKAFWIATGVDVAQIAQWFGVDDLDGTVQEEKIYHMAGARTPEAMTTSAIRRLIRRAARIKHRQSSAVRPFRAAVAIHSFRQAACRGGGAQGNML